MTTSLYLNKNATVNKMVRMSTANPSTTLIEIQLIGQQKEFLEIQIPEFPSEKRDHCMYVGFGQIKKDLKFEVTHNADTTSGMSGGPIYNVWDGLVYGVNMAYDPSEHLNTGVKITKRLYKTIQHWMDQYH